MVSGRQRWICGDIHGEVSALVRYGSSKRVWWPDEAPTQVAVGSVPSADSTGSSTNSGTLSPTELTEAADILVSHDTAQQTRYQCLDIAEMLRVV